MLSLMKYNEEVEKVKDINNNIKSCINTAVRTNPELISINKKDRNWWSILLIGMISPIGVDYIHLALLLRILVCIND